MLKRRGKQLRTQAGCRTVFFQEFLKNPRQVASIIPSSRFLERRVVEMGEIRSAQTIVELGAGTGGMTQAILDAMPQSAKLLSIEINPRFHAFIKRIQDNRLIAHCGSAHELKEIISSYGLPAPEVVVSGIPFSTMNPADGSRILEAVASVLVPGGRFVAYQVRNRVHDLSRPFLGSARVEVELRNIPPLRVYRWKKHAI